MRIAYGSCRKTESSPGCKDKAFYPSAVNYHNEQARQIAKKFIEGRRGLKEVFAVFAKKWTITGAIENNAEEFI